MQTIGDWLREELAERGMTQTHLAQRTGMDRSNISKIVAGAWVPSDTVAARIAKALGLSLRELKGKLGNEETPTVRAGPADGPESQRFPQGPGSELIVEGESMRPYINPGDRLILRAAEWGEQPSPGETVVVWIEGKGQAVYAWCAMPSGKVRLMKHNPAHARETIEVDPSEIQRLLRVERVVRRPT